MAVLQKNNYYNIFWGEGSQFITGLDPLGLKASSQGIYSLLLPGITNVSNRIRYYSFYCWLFNYYFENIRDSNPQKQKDFLRKADFILVLLMKSFEPATTNITGSLVAEEVIAKNSGEYFDLNKHAIQSGGNKTYFANPFGAFGQFYVGPMKQLQLIKLNKHNQYLCTEDKEVPEVSGEALGKAFKESVGLEVCEVFISTLEEGKLHKKDMKSLYEKFSTSAIKPYSEEWKLILKMILQPDDVISSIEGLDHKSNHRKESITLLLESYTIQDRVNYYTLLDGIYSLTLQDGLKKNDTWNLWFLYTLNDYYQYAAGAIFYSVLKVLEEKPPMIPLTVFIREICESSLRIFLAESNQKKNDPIKAFVHNESKIETNLINEIDQLNKQNKPFDTIAWAFKLFFLLHKSNRTFLTDLKDLTHTFPVLEEGNVLDVLDTIEDYKGDLESFFYDYLLREIIYRHHYNGIRKMRGNQSSLKFILEEGTITFIRNFDFSFSSPRLGTVQDVVEDLKLVKGNQLTSLGEAILRQLEKKE